MNFHRGDVVIIDHPYSDARGAKVRPALVIQSDARNAILSETIIVMISRTLKHIGTDQTQLLIAIGTPEGKASGLKADSAVKCGKLFTVHESLIRKRIGALSALLMRQIDQCLKVALDLP
jgi:mRNA interferase MazF